MVLGKTTKEFHRRGRLDLSYAFRRITAHIYRLDLASTWVVEKGTKVTGLSFRPIWYYESLGNPLIFHFAYKNFTLRSSSSWT